MSEDNLAELREQVAKKQATERKQRAAKEQDIIDQGRALEVEALKAELGTKPAAAEKPPLTPPAVSGPNKPAADNKPDNKPDNGGQS